MLLKNEINDIVKSREANEEEKIELLEGLVLDRICSFNLKLDGLLEILLPPIINWEEFIENLLDVSPQHLDRETHLVIENEIAIFILKLLIEIRIKNGKEIND